MRGISDTLTIGERVSWYRRRRGLSQDVLAGLVGRTTDWLSKAENNRIGLDRLSVIQTLADALGVTGGDLLGDPTLVDWSADTGPRALPALRAALMDYRMLTPLFALGHPEGEPIGLIGLSQAITAAMNDYQSARYARVVDRLPELLSNALAATRSYQGAEGDEAQRLLALAYQATAQVMGKVGEAELAWIAADRGLAAAQHSGDLAVTGSLLRSVLHCLNSTGRFAAALHLLEDAEAILRPTEPESSCEQVSVYGALHLAGAMAAARAGDRNAVRDILGRADQAARRIGMDSNYLWTAFGPTNVAIHTVATAGELGDHQIAADLGQRVDTRGLPVERQVRHKLEVARAFAARNRCDEALDIVLQAELVAPEQVRHHPMGRELVLRWIRNSRGRPRNDLTALARRLHLVA
ncbi:MULTISPECIES: helix-turn-helix domain-containing protein [Streptomyces]|uniref:Helix-turn-helix transcriptional regulator n=2 Tax=Streptomyces TaxID=1883 RepID=A0ABU2RHL3_9ACTN|nr:MULTISPECIES: helix-turn-helix transcriptional regulator [unclassified Streptomyces]MBK3591336.1 helix-turn-helix domain-containing protein [Streptomyces sp. MBT51]MDT0428351.1 helix-turn-helix transcriptional regulator [Streptomyces sp. DSM 41770]